MYLQCFGELTLVAKTKVLTQPQPLVLLAYLAVSKESNRKLIADFFWAHVPSHKKRRDSLATALRSIERLHPELIERGRKHVKVELPSDVAQFLDAFKVGDYERALSLYQGPFLKGTEANRRLKLGVEVEEWLINTREDLQLRFFTLSLNRAEAVLRKGDVTTAATLLSEAWSSFKSVAYLGEQDYGRIHTLFLATGLVAEAKRLKQTVTELGIYDVAWSTPKDALTAFKPSSIPSGVTRLIGRKKVTTKLVTALESGERLISICGLGGVGKTELLIHLGQVLKPSFERISFVSCLKLSADIEEDELLAFFLKGLGIDIPADRESKLALLAQQSTCLLVDNFEHILSHKALLQDLIRSCPRLHIMVTSQQVLGLEAETVVYLEGLKLSKTPYPVTETSPATELFISACLQAGYTPGEAEWDTVYEILERLAGLPLAIKLVAAWTASLSLEAILTSLQKSLELLAKNPANQERHESIEAAFDFSYARLDAGAKDGFAKLALFEQGANLAALRQVCQIEMHDLRALRQNNFLTIDTQQWRYQLHPILHLYASKKLQEHKDLARLREAHAEYYISELCKLETGSASERQNAPTALHDDLPNLKRAWLSLLSSGDEERLYQAAHPFELLADTKGWYNEVIALFDEVLLKPQGRKLKSNLLASKAWLVFRKGQLFEAEQLATQALALAETYRAKKTSLTTLASIADSRAEYDQTLKHLAAALELNEKGSLGYAVTLFNLGVCYFNLAQHELAIRHIKEAKTVFLAKQETRRAVMADNLLGQLYLEQEAYSSAERVLRASLKRAERQKLDQISAFINIHLATALGFQAKFEEANLRLGAAYTFAKEHVKQDYLLRIELAYIELAREQAKDSEMLEHLQRAYELALDLEEGRLTQKLITLYEQIIAVMPSPANHLKLQMATLKG